MKIFCRLESPRGDGSSLGFFVPVCSGDTLDGDLVQISVLKSGAIAGEMSLFGQKVRTATLENIREFELGKRSDALTNAVIRKK